MIDRETIDRIFATADIVEVVGDFVKLKRAGSNYKGLSPFSNEKTPSFMVSPAKGIFKCFSSAKGGNAVTFIMEHERLSYPEALKYLAKKYNIEIKEKELTAEEIKEQNIRESLLSAVDFAAKQFMEWLWNREEGKAVGLSYFKERGIREVTIKKFQLGYSFEQRDAFTKLAIDKGYKLEYLTKAGLSIDKGNYQFDRFAGRVIFPIHSLSGQVIGFGGRILKKDDKTAKYLNSPESDIYHKSQVLYGLYFAKKEILTADRCFLVEGYTDVISMHQNGIENVVASSGTALTVEQIRLIKRFTKNITVLYDGDEAGIKASLRGIDLILEEGMNVKVLLLPEGEDPDSFSQKHSSSEFLKFIEENETDFIRFKTKLLAKEAENDPVKRATLITNVVRSIAVIPDGIARSVYLRECSRILDIGEDVLYVEIQKIRRNTFEEKSKKSSYSQPSYPEISQKVKKVETSEKKDSLQHEKDLIQSLLLHGNEKIIDTDGTELTVAQFIIKELDDEIEFQHPVYKIIYEDISAKISDNLPFDDTVFLQNENPEISRVTADLLAVDYELSKIWKKQEVFMETSDMKLNEIIPEMLNAFKYFTVQKLIKDTLSELANVQKNNNDEEVGHYQQKYLILSELIRSLSNDLGRRVILR